jgi:hypothetical protein
MSMTITIEDTATPALRRAMAALKDRKALHAEMGMAVERQVVRHFRTVKVPQGNRLRGVSTGFWKKAAASVKGTASETEAVVRVPARGVALQYYGGTVKAKGKPLTIPIHPAAHGKSVAEMGVKVYRFLSKKGNWILATDPNTARSGKPRAGKSLNATRIPRYRGGTPLYVLKQAVTIKPHADVLPTREELTETAREQARRYLEAVTR